MIKNIMPASRIVISDVRKSVLERTVFLHLVVLASKQPILAFSHVQATFLPDRPFLGPFCFE